MHSTRERNTATQMLVGFAVIVAGFLFLIDNLGWIEIDMHVHFWPIVLIVGGAAVLAQSPRRGSGAAFAGIFMMLFGAVSLLKGLGLVFISWKVLFPLGVIGLGLLMIFRAKRRPPTVADLPEQTDLGDERLLNVTALLGGFQRNVTTQDFRGGEVTAIMGGCDLDMRTASLNGTAIINVFAIMGGISIKVPIDWSVELEGTPILGGYDEKTMQPKDHSKRLIVRGTAIMGGVEIRN